ncbi:CBS domain pair family protein (fragment) [Candidatus Desulfosporosinus infrequens]|uniref:CBS domain pair family protein n=1 Tax=Candidatus Desulfosporosinus infrequens TaxID=2043169 RepID=A0A2U3KSB4_9FIRM
MKNTPGLTFKNTEKIHIDEIKRHTQNQPVYVNAQIENLVAQGVVQNFIPVVDDNGIFIGIVRRSELISYSANYINPFRHFMTAKIKGHFSRNPMIKSLCFSNEHEAVIFSGHREVFSTQFA